MTKEEQLKIEIKNKYGTVKKLSEELNIPNSTLDAMVNRKDGIMRSGVNNVIKVFNALDLDIESASDDKLRKKISPPELSDSEELNAALYDYFVEHDICKRGEDISAETLDRIKLWFRLLDAIVDDTINKQLG